jgi:hypothetical protein
MRCSLEIQFPELFGDISPNKLFCFNIYTILFYQVIIKSLDELAVFNIEKQISVALSTRSEGIF